MSEYYSTLMADFNPRLVAAQTRWAGLKINLTGENWTEFIDT